MSEQQNYEARAKRMRDAIALQEPDFIPVMPNVQCFPYFHAGYTMADILYDTDMVKAKDAIFRYLDKFQPDALFGHRNKAPLYRISGKGGFVFRYYFGRIQ